MAREDHASVDREGYTVPLIGIPPQAVLDECDLCHDELPVRDLEYDGRQLLCKKCMNKKTE